MRTHTHRQLRLGRTAAAIGAGVAAISGLFLPLAATPAGATVASPGPTVSSSPVAGKIKHVWLIILENKSYDASETGLNSNSYLWSTLPSQGVLLKNYYGTGHFSQDNYESLVSGQAPELATQGDCGVEDSAFGSPTLIADPTTGSGNGTGASGNPGTINTGTVSQNFGQVFSALGSNANDTTSSGTVTAANGCSYPETAPTLFNQFDAAGVTWKGYAQDLGGASPNSPTAASAPGISSTGAGYVSPNTVDLRPNDGPNKVTPSSSNGNASSDTQNRDASACGGPGSATNFPGAVVGTASTTGSTVTSNAGAYGVKSFGGAQPDDQYVAKHFPFPFFQSLTGTTGTPLAGTSASQGTGITTPVGGGTDCDANHIANLDDPNNGLAHDLASEATTPAFSWISPNNCSDAHDATCVGNNLSGAFAVKGDGTVDLTKPKYFDNGADHYDPEQYAPINYVGGLYASDLFLAYYIPLIENSPAFKDGGLIDVTWDEANPPYVGSSFSNQPTPNLTKASGNTLGTAGNSNDVYGASQTPPAACASPTDNSGQNTVLEPCTPYFGSGTNPATNPDGSTDAYAGKPVYAPGASTYVGALGLMSDAAGQNINGVNQNSEPQGPNSVEYVSSGKVVGPGPGDAGFIDRTPSNKAAANETGVALSAGSPQVIDSKIRPGQTGVAVTDPNCGAVTNGYCADGFPAPAGGVFVGQVTNTGPNLTPGSYFNSTGGQAYSGSWLLVDQNGNAAPTATTATGLPTTLAFGAYNDPVADASDLTPGGGDTGSILISPYITPGTSTTSYYNHYSWLKTMEDIFQVGSATTTASPSTVRTAAPVAGSNNPVFLTDGTGGTYTVAGGLDGAGHLGYAAQPGLGEFGTDVFNNPAGTTAVTPTATLPETPLVIGLPLLGLASGGVYLGLRRRQRRLASIA